jgi:signal peptidase
MSAVGFAADTTSAAASSRARVRAVTGWTRWVIVAALWTVGGLLFGICASVTLPYVVGGRSLTVLSGSMEPTIHVGDVVVVRPVSPLDLQIGDVITFRAPDAVDKLITHRVRGIRVEAASVRVTTRGDANTTVERWHVPTEGTVGRVMYRIPRLGYLLSWVRGPFGRLLLVVLPALLLGAFELVRIWRPTRPSRWASDA